MLRFQACFEHMAEAGKALQTLKGLGYSRAYLDMADDFDTEFARESNPPATVKAPSLWMLVMKSGGGSYDATKGALMASDPSVSGLGRPGDVQSFNTWLYIHADQGQAEEIHKVITQYGGTLKDFSNGH